MGLKRNNKNPSKPIHPKQSPTGLLQHHKTQQFPTIKNVLKSILQSTRHILRKNQSKQYMEIYHDR